MACEHKRIMSRNCVLYCADCGVMLPAQCAAGGAPAKGKASGDDGTEKKPRRSRKGAEKE